MSKKLDSKKKTATVQTILDITNRSSSVSSIPNAVEENIEDQMQLKHIEEQNNTQETPLNVAEKKSGDNKILSNSDVTEEVFEKYSKVVKEIEEKQTSKLSSDSDSDSGVDSPRTSEESLKSSVSSSRSSVSSILSSAKEDEDQMHTEQAAPEEPQVQESGNSDGQEGKILSQVKGELKSNGKEPESALLEEEPKLEEQKKEAVLSKQEASNNQNNSEVKQPNNRNLRGAFTAGCIGLAVGCLVAGVTALGAVGGLLIIAAVFTIATAVTWYLTPPSSKLTSTNLSRPVDDKELTAYLQR